MRLHSDAVALLEGWTAPNSVQERLRRRYVDHLAAHRDGVFRKCRPDHLTASTLVLSPDGDRALLTLHAKARRWFQFGGHLEPGDASLLAAAEREAREESGLCRLRPGTVPVQLSEHAVPFCGSPQPGETRVVHHLDVRFLAVAADDDAHAISDESLDVRWWPVSALPDPDPDLVELIELARARLSL